MIKELLKKCAELINRDDIVEELNNVNLLEEIEDQQLANDIIRLLNYYNYIVSSVFEFYLPVEEIVEANSDESSKIYYNHLGRNPNKINWVKTKDEGVTHYSLHIDHILVTEPIKPYIVSYNFTPSEIYELNTIYQLPLGINDKIICYGVASEFFASKDQLEKSEYWRNRFLYEIFKIKTKKERRLKKTFWQKQIYIVIYSTISPIKTFQYLHQKIHLHLNTFTI